MKPPAKKIRVLVADDHTIFREGLRSCLSCCESLEIAGEASDGEDAVRKAKELGADVVLMDLNMPKITGLEAADRLHQECPDTKVLILTVHKNPEYVQEMIRCGAKGYVIKDASPQEIVQAIETVNAGRSFFSPAVSGALVDFCMHSRETGASLSPREREVLQLVAGGRSTKEIATALNITFRTAETHRERIMRKLGIHNIAGLTRYAIRQGLIDAD
jgi:DNA-binding NarL/FixJ family response regulator